MLLLLSLSSAGFAPSGLAPGTAMQRTTASRLTVPTMAQTAEERWTNYKAAVAAERAFAADVTAESALALCRAAVDNRDVEPEAVCEALLTVEKAYRAAAKTDGGELSRATLKSLDGAWRLVFTTGTVETQSKIGRKINYFPLRATQTFDTSTTPMRITNGIFLGSVPVLKFFGTFDWLEDRRRLDFDFDAIAVLGARFDLPKGGAEKLGAATGLGAENNVQRAEQGKKAFFVRASVDPLRPAHPSALRAHLSPCGSPAARQCHRLLSRTAISRLARAWC